MHEGTEEDDGLTETDPEVILSDALIDSGYFAEVYRINEMTPEELQEIMRITFG